MSKRTYEEYIKNGCHPVGYNEPCQSYYFGQTSVDLLLDKIDQLKQQLNIERTTNDNWYKREVNRRDGKIKNQREEIKKLKQELAEKDKRIAELEGENKVGEFWHSAYKGKQLDYDMVYTELRKCLDELEKHKQSQAQLAIQELEKVKDWLNEPFDEDGCFKIGVDLIDFIDQQINDLRGE